MADPIPLRAYQNQASEIERLTNEIERALKGGPSGPNDGGMDQRVSRLETHFEYVRKDLDEIKSDQKAVLARLNELPTKRDLTTNILVMVAIGLSVLAITIGGVVGGMAWLDRTREPAVQSPGAAPLSVAAN